MSNKAKYLNRLNDLFSGTDLLDPEPRDGSFPESISNKDRSFQERSDTVQDDATQRIDDVGESPEINGVKYEEGVVADVLGHPEPDWVDILTETVTRVGWEDYLDAINHDEQIDLRFDSDRDEIIQSAVLDDKDIPEEDGNTIELPLNFGGHNLGTIELDAGADRKWSEEESHLIGDVIQQMGFHIENLRLLSQTEHYREEAEEAVRRLTRTGWESYLDSQPKPILGYLYDRNRVVPLDEDQLGYVERFEDISSSGNENKLIEQPLIIRDETIGKLVLEPRNGFTGAELLKTVAERLSAHLESLRLLDETELARQQLDRRAAELETVARVSTVATTYLNRETLLQSVVDLTKENFKLYHAHIYLLEEHTPYLELVAGSGEIGRALVAEQHRINLVKSQSSVAKAARYRNGVIIQDVRSDPGYRPYPLLPDTISELSVPMIAGDQVIGVFGVLSDKTNRFGEDEMRTFSTLAAQVAVAMRNAELYAEQTATVERLRELDHLKSSFLANMSHELRTPLNSILGFAQVILEGIDGPLTEEMENDLQLIAKNGKHLLSLINDVLDMAKIESGRMSLVLEPFDLRELLEDVLQTTEPLIRNKSLYMNLEVNPMEVWEVTADRFRLRQILLNLVGNAIKFTEIGGVTVRAEKREQHFLVSIQDTGIGIPVDQLESIFEAFSQIDSTTTRKAGGTGLGLPISRNLVELHGGRLWAESSGIPGDGTTLWLKLPVEVSKSID